MRIVERPAPRVAGLRTIPTALAGDWEHAGARYRFGHDGTYSSVEVGPYTILNNQLHFLGETLDRIGGNAGLVGIWRSSYPDGTYFDATFGPYGFYSYVWSDGIAGGGYYWHDHATLAQVEHRALVDCQDSDIAFTLTDGTIEAGTFAISCDVLTISFASGIVSYRRVPS